MDEVKFKRGMSISASRILNIARLVEDCDITQDEFFKIMFVLSSLEEAKWNKDDLRRKANAYLESLSGIAKSELENAIEECQGMYINYWDLIDKQNKYKNKNKNKGKENAGTPTKVEPVQEKKKNKVDSDVDFWIEGYEVAFTPRALELIGNLGYDIYEIANYIQENEKILVLPFDPYSIEEIIDMYDDHVKRQYGAK